ncbi:MAG: MarR family winged helix-turn-helix transcriptional regulator [Steroidobacteraceae bacterium]|jgi:DNA-binding MarR family transcriptional regulator|nr:MarR family winged helix-turn-helix transcriptional regulator [Steroidobacteraceae bacterium]
MSPRPPRPRPDPAPPPTRAPQPGPPAGPDLPQALELGRFLPYRLSVLANTMSGAIATAYAERFDLSIPEWRVMAVLALEPGLSAAKVAERTAMDKVAVSRAVASLLRAKRVERSVEACDRRRSQLQLTARGHAVYREVVPFALAYEEAVLRGLPPRTREKLDELLEELLRRARALRLDRLAPSR